MNSEALTGNRTIQPHTYAVLDLPEPIAGKVMEIRRAHRDAFRSALPAETTIIGSGGVGCFKPGTPVARVFEVLDRVAAATPPIRSSLGSVIRFPNTDIFVFAFADEAALRDLHERMAGSGLEFEDNPWPFTPHVTLRSRSPVTEEDAASLFATRISGTFELNQMSVYQLSDDPLGHAPVICTLLHRTRLGRGIASA
jgi:2'-5' RNA ligase